LQTAAVKIEVLT